MKESQNLSTFHSEMPNEYSNTPFPKHYQNKSLFASPLSFSHQTSEHFPTIPPHISYSLYRSYHSDPKSSHRTPQTRVLYHPEKIQISPRAKVLIFTKNPAPSSQKNHFRGLRNRLKSLGKKTKQLPVIENKRFSTPVRFPVAWTFAEKLLRLTELSPLSANLSVNKK